MGPGLAVYVPVGSVGSLNTPGAGPVPPEPRSPLYQSFSTTEKTKVKFHIWLRLYRIPELSEVDLGSLPFFKVPLSSSRHSV